MTTDAEQFAVRSARSVLTSLRRHRLAFIQVGAAFDCIRERLLGEISEFSAEAIILVDENPLREPTSGILVVDHLEALAHSASRDSVRLGAFRERVMSYLDSGVDVCLISRQPKTAFEAVPGSSVLTDAVTVFVPLLGDQDRLAVDQSKVGWRLPTVGLLNTAWTEALPRILEELGPSTLGALDSAVFESHLTDGSSLELLRPLDLEALRGAGIVMLDERHVYTYTEQRILDLRYALADVLSSYSSPQPALTDVSEGLWFIERTIRHKTRNAAVEHFGAKWRSQALYGDLPAKVLERACGDVYPAARSIAEIRDPLEFLTLGELLELVARPPYDGLGVAPSVWRKLAADLLPIRNRLSHMRLLRSGDRDMVRLWTVQALRMFG